MGYSFAAGTTDGPGSFAFEQGTTTSNPMWNAVRNFVAAPTPEDIECQGPKPILLATGRVRQQFISLMSTKRSHVPIRTLDTNHERSVLHSYKKTQYYAYPHMRT